MDNSWEVTIDDIEVALRCTEELAEEIHSELDLDQVCESALYGDDTEEQTENAQIEIRRQVRNLIEDGEIDTDEELDLDEEE